MSTYRREYYQNNRNKINEKAKQYYHENKDALKSKRDDYWHAKTSEYQKNYRENNTDKLKGYAEKYREQNARYFLIKRWEYKGIVCEDFNAMADLWYDTDNCELCNKDLTHGKFLTYNQKSFEAESIACGVCFREWKCSKRIEM